MKKLMNAAGNYTDDMLRGIYSAHGNQATYTADDLRAYCTTNKIPGKVSIVTGGGTGHLPLFLGYVGENMLDGCAVGNVFQSPSAECIFNVSKEVDNGAGVLFLFGNYSGDIMNFDMASEFCEMESIEIRSIVGADDVNSAGPDHIEVRRGVAGIFFLYKCAGAKAAQLGTLDEVYAAAEKAKTNTRSVGFAFEPCIIPEVGHPNFTLGENEMAMGMGIHGEPGIWNGPILTADEIAEASLKTILEDMPVKEGEEVAILINGLGATSIEELYILSGCLDARLKAKGIKIYRTFVGEFATSMEMSGASVSICRIADDEMKQQLDMPVCTPFYTQK